MKKDYIITRDKNKVIEFVGKGWLITSKIVVGWKEPDQDGVVRAVEIEYTLEKETSLISRLDVETK